MSQFHRTTPHGRPDAAPKAGSGPSANEPSDPSPPRKRRPSPLVITAIGVAAAGTIFAAGIFSAQLFAQTSVPATPEPKSGEVRTAETRATGPAQGQTEPGVTYRNHKVASEPWSIHVLKIDRSRKDLTLFSAHAGKTVLGVSRIAEQARAVPSEFGRAIAGVNGDFYDRDNPLYAGDPRGLQITQGELISGPDTVCVWFDPDGNPHLDEVKGDFNVTWPDGSKTPFGLNQRRRSRSAVLYTPTYGLSTRAPGGRELVLEKEGDGAWLPLQTGQRYRVRVREIQPDGNAPLTPEVMVLSFAPELQASLPEVAPGAVLQLSTATTPDLKGVKMAIAGGPAIIKRGKPFSLNTPPPGTSGNYSEASKYQRHPRSAVGWSSTYIYLVTVDGRQPGLSVGMKLAELAEFMVGLGCTDAMNLDGGKSAQMWMNGRIVNSPHQGEDTVANSLLVIRKPEVK